MLQKVTENGCRLFAALQNAVEEGQCFTAFFVKNMMGQCNDLVFSRQSKKVIDFCSIERRCRSCRRALVKEGERISETAISADSDEVSGIFCERHAAFFGDIEKVLLDVFHGNAVKFVALAARENGERDFFRLGGGQDEKHVAWRFFQCFQEGIEGFLRQHVYFIDNVHFLAAGGGKRPDRLLQRTDLLDAPVRCGIDLIDIETCARIDFPADLAAVAGIAFFQMFTIHGFCENFCHTGLSRTARTGEEIGVRQPILLDGTLERDGNMLLPDHFTESAGTPFSIKCEIGHKNGCLLIVKRKNKREKMPG